MIRDRQGDIVVTGMGMMSSLGVGLAENLAGMANGLTRRHRHEYKIRDFDPRPYLGNKKIVKVISERDSWGLVALENCVRSSGIRKECLDPDRTGLFVGAPPCSHVDLESFREAVEAARDADGNVSESEFGLTVRNASPTSLLLGLPNNVLCYGATALDARGPNANYLALELSAHLAFLGAARAMRRKRLDHAFVGGYSGHLDCVTLNGMERRGFLKQEPFDLHGDGMVLADGAVFVALESRAMAEARDASIQATFVSGAIASDGLGLFRWRERDSSLRLAMDRALSLGDVDREAIGLVMLSQIGIAGIDAMERHVVERYFSGVKRKPPFGAATKVFGNMVEAGGVVDIAIAGEALRKGRLPDAIALGQGDGKVLDRDRPYSLILRASPSGEYSCLVVRF